MPEPRNGDPPTDSPSVSGSADKRWNSVLGRPTVLCAVAIPARVRGVETPLETNSLPESCREIGAGLAGVAGGGAGASLCVSLATSLRSSAASSRISPRTRRTMLPMASSLGWASIRRRPTRQTLAMRDSTLCHFERATT